MGKIVATAGWDSVIDIAVQQHLESQGIDTCNVRGYELVKRVGDVPIIKIEMYFNDEPATAGDQE
jgi:hypothetical protein